MDTLGESKLVSAIAEYTREYLRDFPELNRLTEGYDHSPRFLLWAVMDTYSDWAATPPFLGITLQSIIDHNLISLFSRGVAIASLESLSILHLRNYLAYSDGGVNVQTENPQMMQSFIGMMKNDYEMKKQRYLRAKNVSMALTDSGGVHSEYYFLNGFYGAL